MDSHSPRAILFLFFKEQSFDFVKKLFLLVCVGLFLNVVFSLSLVIFLYRLTRGGGATAVST